MRWVGVASLIFNSIRMLLNAQYNATLPTRLVASQPPTRTSPDGATAEGAAAA